MGVIATFRGSCVSARTPSLYQWDYGRTLEIYGLTVRDNVYLHFWCPMLLQAIRKEPDVQDGVIRCRIPDDLLTQSGDIICYVYLDSGTGGETIRYVTIPVNARPKPEDYILPDDDRYPYLVPAGGREGQVITRAADGSLIWIDPPVPDMSAYLRIADAPAMIRSVRPMTVTELPDNGVLVPMVEYYLGERAELSIGYPASAEPGQWCYVCFDSGTSPTNLTIDISTATSLDFAPGADTVCEIHAKWDGTRWVLLAQETTI